ncbi:MAG: amidohydrolase family protein [Ilumatobacteraceae bacterium]
MTVTEDDPATSDLLDGIKIIDCDTHWNETPDLWTSRAPASMKDRMPQLRRVGNEDRWFVDDNDIGMMGATVVTKDLDKIHDRVSLERWDMIDPAGYEVPARLQRMDDASIFAQIVYPNGAGFMGANFAGVTDHDLRLACVRIYNDAAAEWQAASGDRLLPQALIPPWDRDEAAAEVQRATEELGLRGVTLGDPAKFGVPGFTTEHWQPFFEYCDSARVPVNFHIGGTRGIDSFSAVWDDYGEEKHLALASTLFYLANWATIGNFLISGLFDRYTNLKIVSVESGIGWIPFALDALEYQIDETAPNETRHLQRRPTEYFRDHVLACFWFEKFAPVKLIEAIGVDNVLFETDFPHPTCLWPDSLGHAVRVLGHLSHEDRKKVLQDNAAALYKIDVDA